MCHHDVGVAFSQGIQSLTSNLQKKGQQKRVPEKAPAQVSSVATFKPSVTGRERNKSPPGQREHDKSPPGANRLQRERDKSPPIFDLLEENLQWNEPATAKSPVEELESTKPPSPPLRIPQSQPPPSQTHREHRAPPPVPPHGRNKDGSHRDRGEREQWQGEVQEQQERERKDRERKDRERREREERERKEKEERERKEKEDQERRERDRDQRQRDIEREMVRRDREREAGKQRTGGVVLRRQAPRAAQGRGGKQNPPASSPDHVPLRKKPSMDRPAGLEEGGPVVGIPASYKKLHPAPSHPAPVPPSQDPVSDLVDQETACTNLPPSSEWGQPL